MKSMDALPHLETQVPKPANSAAFDKEASITSSASLKRLLGPFGYVTSILGILPYSWKSDTSAEIELRYGSLQFALTLINLAASIYVTIASVFLPIEEFDAVSVAMNSSKQTERAVLFSAKFAVVSVFGLYFLVNIAQHRLISKAWSNMVKTMVKVVTFEDCSNFENITIKPLQRQTCFIMVLGLVQAVLYAILHITGIILLKERRGGFDLKQALWMLGSLYGHFWPVVTFAAGYMIALVFSVWAGLFEILAIQAESLAADAKSAKRTDRIQWILDTAAELEDAMDECVQAFKWHILMALMIVGTPILFGSFFLYAWLGGKGPNFAGEFSVQALATSATMVSISLSFVVLAKICGGAEQVGKAERKLENRLRNSKIWSDLPLDIVVQMQNYILKVNAKPFRVSLGGYIHVNNGFLTSIVTGAITYVVILIQFNAT